MPATISTTARGPRYIAVGDNPNLSANSVKPLLAEFTWKLETSADTPVRPSNTSGVYTITTNWLFRYIFRQVTSKKYTKRDRDNSFDGSTSGFDQSQPPIGSSTQTYVYPDVSEVKVVDLPPSFPASYFDNGVADWSLVSHTEVWDEATGIWTNTDVMEARTKWMRTSGMTSKITLPSLSSITESQVMA